MGESYVDRMLTASRISVFDWHGSPHRYPASRSTAISLVAGGRAFVQGPNRIRMLWGKKSFPRYIRERDGFTCTYCGQFGNTVDHVWPRSRGGNCTPANCVCACRTCNSLKGALSVADFLAMLGRMRCSCYQYSNGVMQTCLKHRVLQRAPNFLLRVGNLGLNTPV